MSYWDTSALAKLYTSEPDSSVFEAKAKPGNAVFQTARVTLWEFRRVTLRKELAGSIPANASEIIWDELKSDIASGWLQIVAPTELVQREFDRVMTTCYRVFPAVPLRTLDALHLASAKIAGETEVVTTDHKLREAAAKLGFQLFPI